MKKDFIYCQYKGERKQKGEKMKVRIEMDSDIGENEVLIRCCEFNEEIQKLQRLIAEAAFSENRLVLYQGEKEFYLPVKQILFFETCENEVQAHTAADVFSVRYRLYELEKLLPASFLRISKSTILNVDEIYCITKNLTSSSITVTN